MSEMKNDKKTTLGKMQEVLHNAKLAERLAKEIKNSILSEDDLDTKSSGQIASAYTDISWRIDVILDYLDKVTLALKAFELKMILDQKNVEDAANIILPTLANASENKTISSKSLLSLAKAMNTSVEQLVRAAQIEKELV